jgi:HKD family nuclease
LDYAPGLNEQGRLLDRMAQVLRGARRLDVAAAYAKSSGTSQLVRLGLPPGSRAVVGLGFGITDPVAVEQLEDGGVEVRVVPDGAIAASQFHPKLYVVERPDELVTVSGSANLTGAGWTTNVEQFEELRFPDPSAGADAQRTRYELVWDHGVPVRTLRRSGDWDLYRQRVRDRRSLEREDRRRLARLQATTGQLVGVLARRETRQAPGYLGITHPDWWELQLRLRDQADRALFWRRNTKEFRALATGGVFFHLVKTPGEAEDQRAVRGYSLYPGDYEVADARDLFARYGAQLGVHALGELYERLGVEPGRAIGVIHLESLIELDREVTLDELRANGVDFARNIVSGRSLTLGEVATVFELGGLGVPQGALHAAESGPEEWGL